MSLSSSGLSATRVLPVLLAATMLALVPAPSAAAPKRANLAVTAVAATPATVAAGGSLTVTDTVSNGGAKAARATEVRLLLSSNAVRDKADVALGSHPVRGLARKRRANASLAVTVPATTAAGTWRVLACADGGGKVAESSERDNCRASAPVTVTAAGVGAVQPDGTPPAATIPGITLVRNDEQARQKLTAAGNLMYEWASFGSVTAEYARLWLMADGGYRLNVIDYNSAMGEKCRSASVGTWALAEGYTFSEEGGGYVLKLAITTSGATAYEVVTYVNSKPANLYVGAKMLLFTYNANIMQNC